MVLQGDSVINLKGLRSKKKKMVDNSNRRPWSELPDALRYMITKLLGTIDYLMFGCVCRAWRLYAVANRQEFMASQPPLVMFMPNRSKRACYFYNIFDGRKYKAKLPNLVGKICYRISYGHELRVLNPPLEHNRVILASLETPLSKFVITAFRRYDSYLQFCRSTYADWSHCDCNDHWIFVDLTVYKRKLYAITTGAGIGVVNLNSCPYVTPLEVKSIPNLKGGLWLRGPDEQLLLINAIGNNHEVYELNFLKMEWVKMQNLGDQALFLDYYEGGLGFSNKTRWKDSERPSNGRYYFDRDNTTFGSTSWMSTCADCTISFVIREIQQWEPNYTFAECIEDNAEHSEDQTDVQNAECSAQDTG
ncbi:uncharacterized protein LOC126703326 [Quercus robur]|uniref:uncharacterized protein LOC126703326 n=1 Tax=Quercus robur TaxID=38942 RepID=UPI0021632CD5|nr:uncharacterized protein LOC126703326 [Quercus robur]